MWNGGRRKNSRSFPVNNFPFYALRLALVRPYLIGWTTPLSLDALNSVASYPNNKRIRALRPCVRPETTVCSRERRRTAERLSTYTYIDIVSVRAGCRCTTYENEAQVSKVVNQTQVSSSPLLNRPSVDASRSFFFISSSLLSCSVQ